jgi:hypothetical protein
VISHEHKAIFVHVPKTGGQSIERVFLDLHGLDWDRRRALGLGQNEDPRRGPRSLAHLRAWQYVACGHVTREQFDNYFRFAFVRNPWDRLVSEYRYRRVARHMGFAAWLRRSLPVTREWSDHVDHLVPQCEYLYDADGACLVDFVGRFERLADDFGVVRQRLGLPDVPLPHVNASARTRRRPTTIERIRNMAYARRTHYTEYYDRRSAALVRDVYRDDIETFGYEFGA